jgi:hypothetical protein
MPSKAPSLRPANPLDFAARLMIAQLRPLDFTAQDEVTQLSLIKRELRCIDINEGFLMEPRTRTRDVAAARHNILTCRERLVRWATALEAQAS